MLLRKLLPAGTAGLLLASCTVYAPMQPVMPLVSQRGQAELGTSLQPLGRLEVTGAYSPLRRVILAGGLTGAPRLGQDVYLVTAQYEAGAGLYQPLGQHWLLSNLGGFGQAYSHRSYRGLDNHPTEYEARYQKYFGQLGMAYRQPDFSCSLTYRFTQVEFSYLNYRLDPVAGAYARLPLPAMARHELALSMQNQFQATSRWQVAGTAGLSVAGTARLDDNPGYPIYGTPEYQANRNLLPAFFASLGVVFRPGKPLRPW
ncbi:MAG: hypothetical protein ACRYFX_28685 [Janthinobacterium lividum]